MHERRIHKVGETLQNHLEVVVYAPKAHVRDAHNKVLMDIPDLRCLLCD